MSDVMDRLIEMNGLRFHYRDWPAQNPNAEVLVLMAPEKWRWMIRAVMRLLSMILPVSVNG